MSEELKPCPWCGVKPDIQEIGGSLFISCKNPKCFMRPDTWLTKGNHSINKQIKLWNRRDYE